MTLPRTLSRRPRVRRRRRSAGADVEHAGEAFTTEVERTQEQLEAKAERQRGLAEVEAERASSGESALGQRPPVARVRGALRAELDRSRRLERQRERDRDRENERLPL